jgi:hypothetical protein
MPEGHDGANRAGCSLVISIIAGFVGWAKVSIRGQRWVTASPNPHPTKLARRKILQRQIVVLLHRRLDVLVFQHRQRPGDALAGRVRHDDVVEIAALGGDEG